jgi:hypothetical protein
VTRSLKSPTQEVIKGNLKMILILFSGIAVEHNDIDAIVEKAK